MTWCHVCRRLQAVDGPSVLLLLFSYFFFHFSQCLWYNALIARSTHPLTQAHTRALNTFIFIRTCAASLELSKWVFFCLMLKLCCYAFAYACAQWLNASKCVYVCEYVCEFIFHGKHCLYAVWYSKS